MGPGPGAAGDGADPARDRAPGAGVRGCWAGALDAREVRRPDDCRARTVTEQEGDRPVGRRDELAHLLRADHQHVTRGSRADEGIGQADALVRSGAARHVLVIGAEKMSEFIDPTDRAISFLLGDGAGAAVVGPSDFAGIERSSPAPPHAGARGPIPGRIRPVTRRAGPRTHLLLDELKDRPRAPSSTAP